MLEIDWTALVAAIIGLIGAFAAMIRYVQKRAVAGDQAVLDLKETQGKVALLEEQSKNRTDEIARLVVRTNDLEHDLAEERGRGIEIKEDLAAAKRRIHELELDKTAVQSANAVLERFLKIFTENFSRVIEAATSPPA